MARTASRAATSSPPGRARPARDLRDGLPQPLPDPGRRRRRRLRDRLLAGLQHPPAVPRPGRTGRVEVVRKPANYGWPLCYSPDLPYYRWNFLTSTPLDSPPPHSSAATPPRSAQRLSVEPQGGPDGRAGPEYSPPITKPDIWYSYQDNAATNPLGNPCFASRPSLTVRRLPLRPPAPSSPLSCSTVALVRTARRRTTTTPTTRAPTKFPPYYDGSFILGEFTRDYLREVRLDAQGSVMKINQLLSCGRRPCAPTDFPFECDNPMDIQFGKDGSLYLLTYGDGFFAANPDAGMYRFDYVKGQRAPKAVLTASPTSGQEPLTVSSPARDRATPTRRTPSPSPGTSTGTARPTRSSRPRRTSTRHRQYTARLTVTDTSGKTASPARSSRSATPRRR